MKAICLYFQVHQPYRLKTFRFFDIGRRKTYWDDQSNASIMQKVSEKCYLPANELIYQMIKKYQGDFRVSFSISGTAMEQFEQYAPEVLESFKKLVSTGCVELLSETYTHGLASMTSVSEFTKQVLEHRKKTKELFGVEPTVFRNTELILDNNIAKTISGLGYKAILSEGVSKVLNTSTPNHLFSCAAAPELGLLLRNFQLSDDIAFRFSDQSWSQWPLNAKKFVGWLKETPDQQEIINLFMDYETFGEHQWATSGIFTFLKELPQQFFKQTGGTFFTPSEAVDKLEPRASLSIPETISWADEEKDLSAWLGNNLQKEAYEALYSLRDQIKKCTDKNILRDWKLLQTSDHFYYMCTKKLADGEVHQYFNPYSSPYLAFINYMNVISDFEIRVKRSLKKASQQRLIKKLEFDEEMEASHHYAY